MSSLPIADFSHRRAKRFALNVFWLGAVFVLILSIVFGTYYHHTRQSQIIDLVSHSVTQPLLMGGDYLPSRIIDGLTEANYFHNVWLLDKNQNVILEKHVHESKIPFEEIKSDFVFWDHWAPHLLIKRDIFYYDHLVGSLVVGYLFPFDSLAIFALILFSLFAVVGLYFGRTINKFSLDLSKPFIDYHQFLAANVGQDSFLAQKPNWPLSEVNYFHETLAKLQRRHKKSEGLVRRAVSNAQLEKITSRVKHDIITAIAIADSALDGIKDNFGSVATLTSVFERISSIVEDIPKRGVLTEKELNEAAKINGSAAKVSKDRVRNCHLVSLIKQSLDEVKGSSFCRIKKIDFKLNYAPSVFDAFVEVEGDKFKRNILNLLKNATEAIESQGEVQITIVMEAQTAYITIADSGCGIAPEHLAQIGRRGVSFNKADGSGIGVAACIEDIKRWHGTFKIESEVTKGTRVCMALPLSKADILCPTSLHIAPESTVLVVDDDILMHSLWEEIFKNLPIDKNGVRIEYFTNIEQTKRFISDVEDLSNVLLLTDYDLRDKSQNGIDLVREFKLESNSIVISANGTSNVLYEQCSKHNLRLISKSVLGQIPVSVE